MMGSSATLRRGRPSLPAVFTIQRQCSAKWTSSNSMVASADHRCVVTHSDVGTIVMPTALATYCEMSRPLSITVTAATKSAASTPMLTLGVARTISANRLRIRSVWSQLMMMWKSSGTTAITHSHSCTAMRVQAGL